MSKDKLRKKLQFNKCLMKKNEEYEKLCAFVEFSHTQITIDDSITSMDKGGLFDNCLIEESHDILYGINFSIN